MSAEDEVLAAAQSRAAALAAGDESALRALLHPDFGWTSHTGERFDRERYVRSNIEGATLWHHQSIDHATLAVEGAVVVLRCIVADDVTVAGRRRVHRMPCTQTWVASDGRWQLLAGHAGPLLAAE
jgi:ketosteroid isomerase-like protein